MSDWVEYCNLENEGEFAKWRIENGFPTPHNVKFWSIGNENYGSWEIGAKSAQEWGRLVLESAKMMQHVDPTIQLTAAALPDLDWNLGLLRMCGDRLGWISIHKYWDAIHQTNDCAPYEQVMAYTADLEHDLDRVRGLLTALGLEKQIRIAYDEWNLRGWYHPNVHTVRQGITKEDYLSPPDQNDDNSSTPWPTPSLRLFLNTLTATATWWGWPVLPPLSTPEAVSSPTGTALSCGGPTTYLTCMSITWERKC